MQPAVVREVPQSFRDLLVEVMNVSVGSWRRVMPAGSSLWRHVFFVSVYVQEIGSADSDTLYACCTHTSGSPLMQVLVEAAAKAGFGAAADDFAMWCVGLFFSTPMQCAPRLLVSQTVSQRHFRVLLSV